MTYRIEVTNDARNDLRQIREYISVELGNENSASRTVGSIVKSIGSLRAMPEIVAPLSARVSIKTDYRYLVCGNYNVFYRIETDSVKIVRVLNARRNFMAVLFGTDDTEA